MANNDPMWRFRCARPLPKGGKTLVMGVVNLTPDSFSDGGRPVREAGEAADEALAMIDAGADVVDFGAESSRPGAATVSAAEEIARLGDVIKRVRERATVPLSVDTYHPETAAVALEQGADIVNDITGLRGDWLPPGEAPSEMARLAARERAHVIVMHMPAPPRAMQESPEYLDVVSEVKDFLLRQAEMAERAGIQGDRVWLDPGFGFGKTFRHNRELLLCLGDFAESEYPVAVGLSRKRMIHDALGLPPDERLEASIALAVMASLAGAEMIRVHDVRATARALAMTDAVRGESEAP